MLYQKGVPYADSYTLTIYALVVSFALVVCLYWSATTLAPNTFDEDLNTMLWLLSGLFSIVLLERNQIEYGGMFEFFTFMVMAPVMMFTLIFLFEFYLPRHRKSKTYGISNGAEE